jgi:AbrB family looped-hinge helix DNA binding protein
MIVRLSTKGQLVIPRKFREALGLEAGTQFEVELKADRIILTPVMPQAPLAELYGKYKGTNLLDALEADHKQELAQEGKALPKNA